MPYNENPNAVNPRIREIEIIEEEIRDRRRTWIKNHMTAIYIGIGVLIALLVFIGIRIYNNNTNPLSRFISSSSKNLSSSFSFNVEAEKNGESMMRFSGAMKANPSAQKLEIAYDAEYADYSYSNVIYTDGETSYKGNYYKNHWTVTDCTNKVKEYFDFFTDYRHGNFDSGAFLRFTELNNFLYSIELNRFMVTVKDRLSTDSSIVSITSRREGSDMVYRYDFKPQGALDLIKDYGASVFYTSPDYYNFVSRIEANEANIAKSKCFMEYTVNGSGNMSRLSFSILTGEDSYIINCEMSGFNDSVPEIPDDFYTAASIKKPE